MAPRTVEDAAANQALRELASRLLNEKQVQVVLGWEQGSVRRRPLFARTVEQAQRLLVNIEEPLNLVNYLRNLTGAVNRPGVSTENRPAQRVAVLVSPNDLRTLNVLIAEGQLRRDDLFLIGLGEQPAGRYDATLPLPSEWRKHGACNAWRLTSQSRSSTQQAAIGAERRPSWARLMTATCGPPPPETDWS